MAKKKQSYSQKLSDRLSKRVFVKDPFNKNEVPVKVEKPKPHGTTRVFRMEVKHENGQSFGPYTAGCYIQSLERVCSKMRGCLRGYIKEPKEDGCAIHEWYHVVGFEQIEWATHWFGPFYMIKELMDCGFEFNEYEVTECYKGETQVVWCPSDATLVKSYNYEEFLDLFKYERRYGRRSNE